jgi:hypothetical protein
MEAQNGAVEVCSTVIADTHQFDEQQDPDPCAHQSGKMGPDTRTKVMRINMLSQRKSKGHEDWPL